MLAPVPEPSAAHLLSPVSDRRCENRSVTMQREKTSVPGITQQIQRKRKEGCSPGRRHPKTLHRFVHYA